jgi:PAS domain S-box-containing protein
VSAEPLIQSTLLGEAIDSGPVAVFVADDEARYVAVNQFACDLLGYTRAELLSMRVLDVARYPEAPHEFADVVAHRLEEGRSELVRKDGSTLTIEYRVGETKVAGMTFYVCVGWPVSEPGS